MQKYLLLTLVPLALVTTSMGRQEDREKLTWAHLKTLAGDWHGQANDGRKIRHRYSLIAGESVIMEESWFDAHPGQKMVTMYYMDGSKLFLVHYCVAKNQPRLQATEISADGKSVLFSFHDGGNIPNRDKGHMDKAQFNFTTRDKFSNKWTWYQNGKEQWMEEFTFFRTKPAPKLQSK